MSSNCCFESHSERLHSAAFAYVGFEDVLALRLRLNVLRQDAHLGHLFGKVDFQLLKRLQ